MSGRAIYPGPADAPPALDMMEVAPELPRYARDDVDQILAGRRPTMGEFLGASVREGWWGTLFGLNRTMVDTERAAQADPEPLPRHEWEASQYWRQGVQWDERMTVGRARAMAEVFDENRYRRQVMAARDPGLLEAALGFGAQMGGAVFTPENFLPIAGPVTRGLRAAGATRVAAALEAPGLAGGAARGAVEGFGGNLAVAPIVYPLQTQFGDEVTFGRVVTDLAVGAVIGAGFGTLGAALSRAGATPDPVASARTLGLAARDVAAGRPPELPRDLVVRNIEDTLFRSAPDSAAPMIRETVEGGVVSRTLDIPTRPDGAPLSREEFEAEFARREGTTVEAQRQAFEDQRRTMAADARQKSLVQWIVDNGGLRDDGSDVSTLMGSNRARPGLISQRVMAPDMAAIEARNAGFFNDIPNIANRPDALTVRDLYEAIDAELRGLGERRQGGFGVETRQGMSADRMEAEWSRSVDEAHEWYLAAHHAQRQIARLSEPARVDLEERIGIMEDGGATREAATLDAVRGSDDPEVQAIMAQIEALRADGRLTDADMAALRAADEAAAEMEAVANGLEQAGACLLRNLA
jgi:hypothetical protein